MPRAFHLTELRRNIDAARHRCGLPGVGWVDARIVPGTPIRAVHITQPRIALDAALWACGSRPPTWTDPRIVPGQTPVKARHFTELLEWARALLR